MTQIPDPNAVPPPGSPQPTASIPPQGAIPPLGAVPPVGYQTPPVPGYFGPPPTQDERNMGMLCYILGIFGAAGWIGPLIIWMMKKDTSPFINDQGKEVLNWELTVLIAYIIGVPMIFCFMIGSIIIGVTLVCNIVFCILGGAVKANQGIAYRMPFSIKFIK